MPTGAQIRLDGKEIFFWHWIYVNPGTHCPRIMAYIIQKMSLNKEVGM